MGWNPPVLRSLASGDQAVPPVVYEISPLGYTLPGAGAPSGPSEGFVGEKLTFKAKGYDPLEAHEYQFDWGDGTRGSWRSKDRQSHAYDRPGTFEVRARERCPLGLFDTGWSKPRKVKIQTAADAAYMLTVSSRPVTGIAIGGSAPGQTNYIAPVRKETAVTLSAPALVTVKKAQHTFQHWVLGGVPQPAGQAALAFDMDGPREAEAVYAPVTWALNVRSSPMAGVPIAGVPAGLTDYSSDVPDHTRVTLTAPPIVHADQAVYGFVEWTGLPKLKGTSLKQRVRIQSDTTLTANYGPIEMAVNYPNGPGIVIERGAKVEVLWDVVNLPRGNPMVVELVKGGTQTWTLSGSKGTKKNRLKWTVGKAIKNTPPYPDGDDYTIRVSALGGAVWAESEEPFAIAGVDSLSVIGPFILEAGTDAPQYACTAHYNFGPDRDVTYEVQWRTDPKEYASIQKKTGRLTTSPVPWGQTCSVTATYGKGEQSVTGSLEISLAPPEE